MVYQFLIDVALVCSLLFVIVLGQEITITDSWANDDTDFVETSASKHISELTSNQHKIIAVVGAGGSGKSFLIQHEALRLQNKGFEIVIAYEPSDIRTYFNDKKDQVFVSNDCFGPNYLHETLVQKWNIYVDYINQTFVNAGALANLDPHQSVNIKQHVILLSSMLDIYKEVSPNPLKSIHATVVDLTSNEWRLSQNEKDAFINRYMPSVQEKAHMLDFSHPYFPLLCKLARSQTTWDNIYNLFANPVEHIDNDIEQLRNTKTGVKFGCICLCALFDDAFPESWLLNTDNIPRDKLLAFDSMLDEFRLKSNRETDIHQIKSAFNTLNKSYIKYINGIWSIIHSIILESVVKICGNHLFHKFLRYASPSFRASNYILTSRRNGEQCKERKKYQNLITVSTEHEHKYFERLRQDITKMGFEIIYDNIQLRCKYFRNKLLLFIRNDACLQQIISIDQCSLKNKHFEFLARHGYYEIAQFLIAMGCKTGLRPDNAYFTPFLHSVVSWIEPKPYARKKILRVIRVLVKSSINSCGEAGAPVLIWLRGDAMSVFVHGCISRTYQMFSIDIKKEHSLSTNHCLVITNTSGSPKMFVVEDSLDINSQDWFDNSAMIQYIRQWRVEYPHTEELLHVVSLLISHGANTNIIDREGKTALMYTCMYGHKRIVSLLLLNNAKIDIIDQNGHTALFFAFISNKLDIFSMLVDHGANIDIMDTSGKTALIHACMVIGVDHSMYLDIFINRGANINIRDNDGRTALMHATSCFTVDNLIYLGANISIRDNNGRTALMHACISRDNDKVELLLYSGANIENRDNGGKTALMHACISGDIQSVKSIIEGGENINICDSLMKISLMHACPSSVKYTVNSLLDRAAIIEIRDNEGKTALMHACISGTNYIANELIDLGANISIRDNDGRTTLMHACYSGFNDVVNELIYLGANITIRYNDGKTALMHACISGTNYIVNKLIDLGANCDIRDHNGVTGLMYSYFAPNNSTTSILIKRGACINVRDDRNRTTLTYALSRYYISNIDEYFNFESVSLIHDMYDNLSIIDDTDIHSFVDAYIDVYTNMYMHGQKVSTTIYSKSYWFMSSVSGYLDTFILHDRHGNAVVVFKSEEFSTILIIRHIADDLRKNISPIILECDKFLKRKHISLLFNIKCNNYNIDDTSKLIWISTVTFNKTLSIYKGSDTTDVCMDRNTVLVDTCMELNEFAKHNLVSKINLLDFFKHFMYLQSVKSRVQLLKRYDPISYYQLYNDNSYK